MTNLVIDTNCAKFKGLYIKNNNKGGFVVNGSVHKYFNNGEHNANDYSITDFAETLNIMYNELGLNADITPVNGFEFGVNIKLPNSPKNALERLILHKSESGIRKNGFTEFDYQTYSLKMYDKSQLTKIEPYCAGDILRIEVNVKRMKYIRDKGVYCKVLSDLFSVDIWQRLEKVLIETVEQCLFIDLTPDEVNQLSDKLKIRYYQYINPLYWTNLQRDRRLYFRNKKRCESFLNEHSASTLKQDIIKLIESKCKELINISDTTQLVKKWDNLTVFESVTKTEKCDNLTIKINEYNVPLYPIPTEQQKELTCITCGRTLNNPRKGQKYCSAKEVGYNQAHKCRNTDSNPRNNTKKSIRRIVSIGLLFDLNETITPKKLCYL